LPFAITPNVLGVETSWDEFSKFTAGQTFKDSTPSMQRHSLVLVERILNTAQIGKHDSAVEDSGVALLAELRPGSEVGHRASNPNSTRQMSRCWRSQPHSQLIQNSVHLERQILQGSAAFDLKHDRITRSDIADDRLKL